MVYLISGERRVGKTTLSNSIASRKLIYDEVNEIDNISVVVNEDLGLIPDAFVTTQIPIDHLKSEFSDCENVIFVEITRPEPVTESVEPEEEGE